MIKKILKVRKFKAGYEIRTELHDGAEFGCDDFVIKSAYVLTGDYIGNPKDTYRLCVKHGIKPEKSKLENNVCSTGLSMKDGKWYGWSHRAIHGFSIGDEVKDGDCCASSGYVEEYIKKHPEEDKSLPVGFVARTIEDAKRMAIAFAESVS